MTNKAKKANAHADRIWVAWNPDETEPFLVLANTPREAYEAADTDHDPVVIAEYHLAGLHEARRDFVLVLGSPKNTKRERTK